MKDEERVNKIIFLGLFLIVLTVAQGVTLILLILSHNPLWWVMTLLIGIIVSSISFVKLKKVVALIPFNLSFLSTAVLFPSTAIVFGILLIVNTTYWAYESLRS